MARRADNPPPAACVFCALDMVQLAQAQAMAKQLAPYVGGLKLGMEFFYRNGAPGYQAIAAIGLPIFLDVKLHDIPNTVVGALRAISALTPAPRFVSVHAAGGRAMLTAAQAFIRDNMPDTTLLAVTLLTSLDAKDFASLGLVAQAPDPVAAHTQQLAALAINCGIDGLVCSANELGALTEAFTNPKPIFMVPGIQWQARQGADQTRLGTPQQARAQGADYLVIGRAITQSTNPAATARAIAAALDG